MFNFFQDDSRSRLQHLFSHAEDRVPGVPQSLHRHGPPHGHESALFAAQSHEDHAAATHGRTKVRQKHGFNLFQDLSQGKMSSIKRKHVSSQSCITFLRAIVNLIRNTYN